jgi:adenylylsulfate kinase-like enzyme
MKPKAPRLIIFGGANGSGKSTLTQWYKRKLANSSIILDPDAIGNRARALLKIFGISSLKTVSEYNRVDLPNPRNT